MTQQNNHSTGSTQAAGSFSISESMLLSLQQTKPWTKLLAILGFIAVAFLVIGGAISFFVVPGDTSSSGSTMATVMVLVNIVMGAFYFFPSLYLLKYSSAISQLMNGGGSQAMEDALSNQKSFWKFMGILALISFVVAMIGIMAAILIPQFASFK